LSKMAKRNKYDGYRRAKRSWVCFGCGYMVHTKRIKCLCGQKMEYFSSLTEAARGWVLRQLLHKGVIQGLVLHPKYKLIVEGELITTYSADFLYLDSSGKVIIEDVKGRGGFCDRESLLKIKLFNALHKNEGLKIEIKS